MKQAATLLIICALLVVCPALRAETLPDQLATLVKRSKHKVGAVVVDLRSGKEVFAAHEDEPLKPASVLKLLTAVVALKRLGPDYTFKTEVWADAMGRAERSVVLRGGADPDLTIEALWLLLRKIKKLGITKIPVLGLDASRAPTTKGREGQRAYETSSSSLAFNFNSVAFDVCPGGGR